MPSWAHLKPDERALIIQEVYRLTSEGARQRYIGILKKDQGLTDEEIKAAEFMMRREGISWLSSTSKSIEEISTTILQEIRPERLVY